MPSWVHTAQWLMEVVILIADTDVIPALLLLSAASLGLPLACGHRTLRLVRSWGPERIPTSSTFGLVWLLRWL